MEPEFIPGMELSRLFFNEAVRPILADQFPNLTYTAARLDRGSEVLGFDTPMSRDHGWGPKLTLYLNEADFESFHSNLHKAFANQLPFIFHGYPTNFSEPHNDGGQMLLKEAYPINHMVSCTTPDRFFKSTLHINIREKLTPADWLTFPHQRLRTLRAGKVFHDGLGELEELQERFHWYPRDLWLYLMACQWQRISQEAPFLGRTGIVGDELGSHLLADRLMINLMNLAFLIKREYAPYWKWFGTAFQQLSLAKPLTPIFKAIIQSHGWEEREKHLTRAYLVLIQAHNDLKLTASIPVVVRPFYQRPFLVPPTDDIISALKTAITDPIVAALPLGLGNINQISDNTDILDDLDHGRKLKILYT